MKNKLFLIVFVVIFSLTASYYSHGDSGWLPVADSEKRSCIKAVNGYAYLSEDMTIAKLREKAFANAKKLALEAARTHIQSKTLIKNGKIEYDVTWADANGSVNILEQKDHGIEENKRYRVWIKAEVSYQMKPKTPETIDTASIDMPKNAPLTVSVWTDKKTYVHSESVTVLIKGNRDFYAIVVNKGSTGELTRLLPNRHRRVNFFKGGKTYQIPGREDNFNLKAHPPYGQDMIIVYASETQIGHVDVEQDEYGLGTYRGSLKDLELQARAVCVEERIKEFYEASWFFTTKGH
ncbi:DUF4384 domain-containing protein [Candidatus Magnetomoraceae bacterium gMMP-1]